MKRITICGKDDVIDGIKEAAWVCRKSVSRYLVDLHRGSLGSEAVLPKMPIKEDGGGLPEKGEAPKIFKKLSADGLRASYKLSHPRDICSRCLERNERCGCDD